MIPSSSAANNNGQSPVGGLKTYFKTPEGRYKLQYEKTHPAALLHYAHGKTITQVTLAQLKDKPSASATPTSSSLGVSSGVRSAAARFLGTGNGSRALSFVGGNGSSKSVNGTTRTGLLGASTSNNFSSNSNFDAKGTYLIFNVGDAVFISDLNSQDKDPIKSIHFNTSNPVCHAFDEDSKDGHDLLIGLASGDVYSVSLRQQLQDVGKKLVGAQHYNKDGCVNNRPQTTIGTAMVLCHRFFVRKSHACHDRFLISTAAIFLAGKSEETACPLNNVLRASCEMLHNQDFDVLLYGFPVGWFEQYRERVIEAELNVQHPYRL